MDTLDETVQIEKPPRRWWVRWMKRLGTGLLLAVLVLAGRQYWNHYQATKKLDETLAELDRTDPGWRLQEIEAAREQVPEDENSARVVAAAADLLPKDWPPQEFAEHFAHLRPEEQFAPEDFARLTKELDAVRPALDQARKLARMPRGRHRIEYKRNVLSTLLNDQQRSRQVVHLLLFDALQRDQRRDMGGALTSCQAACNAARSVGDEPLSISQLIRTAGVILACAGVERALAQGGPPEENLAAIERLLADEEASPDLWIGARGERALWHEMFEAMERGEVSLAEMAGEHSSWDELVFGPIYRDNIRSQHPTMLAMMTRWITVSQLPTPEQAESERELGEEVRELRPRAALAVLPLSGALKMGDASRRKHASIRCTIIALAAERYRLALNRWPDTLDQLCPQFLADVPRDPFDGRPLRYRRLDDGVVIYSVSSDGVDNGGNLDRERPNLPGADVGFRLWDVTKRHQQPRPKPPAAQPEMPAPNLG